MLVIPLLSHTDSISSYSVVTICCFCVTLRAGKFENKDYDALNEQSVRGESSFTAEDNAEIVTQLQQDGGAGGSWSQGSQ